ncbi:patatin-like phospholipase domain-containing protein 4 [Mus caroli]|uniref:Patatin-like phospholipase domain-containing protein 4 n=1 Tax=Mus caroli TaxID=10089 RepID=A0A6P5R739_MUSCR|nr:patatin-like phospholipase domain-containing protein 4 [Mus caroli]
MEDVGETTEIGRYLIFLRDRPRFLVLTEVLDAENSEPMEWEPKAWMRLHTHVPAPQLWVDGGLTDSLPLLPMGHIVTFSPLSGQAEVLSLDVGWPGMCVRVAKQDVTVSVANLVRVQQALFPPGLQMLEAIYCRGMTDTVRFLHREPWDQ